MTFTGLFETLYETAIKCGISIFDFWNYTYGEIVDLINAYRENQEERTKERISDNYQIALLTSIFTNRANNGKQPPTLQELYPNLFKDELPKEEVDNSWIYYKEQMLDYAAQHNQREVNNQ